MWLNISLNWRQFSLDSPRRNVDKLDVKSKYHVAQSFQYVDKLDVKSKYHVAQSFQYVRGFKKKTVIPPPPLKKNL